MKEKIFEWLIGGRFEDLEDNIKRLERKLSRCEFAINNKPKFANEEECYIKNANSLVKVVVAYSYYDYNTSDCISIYYRINNSDNQFLCNRKESELIKSSEIESICSIIKNTEAQNKPNT